MAGIGWFLFGAGRSTPITPLGPATFAEETSTAGLDQTYDGPLAYFTGGGLATLDCDGDGLLDAYVAGGTAEAALFRNESAVGGAVRFRRAPDPATDLLDVTGAYPLDVDGDAHVDLAVLRIGENVVLRGLGDCRFERANERWALDGGNEPTMAFAATWEGAATLPTLAFGQYVDPEPADPTHPCHANTLVRPVAGGSTYAPPTELAPGFCALSLLFSDWDRSGRRDLRVSNDQHYYVDGEEQLWRMDPGAPPVPYTGDDGWVRVNVEGMGIGSYDVTGDGYPDVYLTSQGENRLQTLTAGPDRPTYRDIGLRRGVLADRPFTGEDELPSTAWHPEFDDVNNDGFIDLFVSKGNVRQQEDFALRDPSNLLLGQADGTFVEAADRAGILSFDLGRGAALADLNLDGMLDLIEVNLGSPVRLWRNVGAGDAATPRPMGHWLGIRLVQPGPNRDAIGAWIETRIGDIVARRELTVGGGHASGELGWTHVGLGSATTAEVRVQWPDGTMGPWQRVAADGWVEIARGAEPRSWTPKR
ncbi:MAG: CRTAC1 family protein [Chloroflexi bacterium]|nr:CRTAC1 family protein [Chloroflexota bacterium]